MVWSFGLRSPVQHGDDQIRAARPVTFGIKTHRTAATVLYDSTATGTGAVGVIRRIGTAVEDVQRFVEKLPVQ